MMNVNKPRCLIAAGCSFTQVPSIDVSWPAHLKEKLSYIECCYFLGQGAAGNGIISRRAIFHTLQALKSYNPEDILVGIMWSGIDRLDFYQSEPNVTFNEFHGGEFYCNPIRITSEHKYYITHPNWDDAASNLYYKNFYDPVNSTIITLEHILRTQLFLQKQGVPYFMTEYSFDVLPRDPDIINNPDVKYLLDLVDKSYWLEVNSMFEWSKASEIPFSRPPDPHPSTEHHKEFTNEIIVPYLIKKNYL